MASDFSLIHAYPGKRFRFGYFPETRHYDGKGPEERKAEDGPVQIVWAGRMMPLKHPEFVVRLAEDLREKGLDYRIHFIGSGELEAQLKGEIEQKGLSDRVILYGFLEPGEVRKKMEESHIHLFTSNHLEGWGAVVNEAMNSGCAVVANSEPGAVPYLIENRVNGMIYREGSYEQFREAVVYLMEHEEERRQMGRRAYDTICSLWNAENAAAQCLRFYENWQKGRVEPPAEGPFSIAPVIWPGRRSV